MSEIIYRGDEQNLDIIIERLSKVLSEFLNPHPPSFQGVQQQEREDLPRYELEHLPPLPPTYFCEQKIKQWEEQIKDKLPEEVRVLWLQQY